MEQEFIESLLEHDDFLLTTHIRPDGDAVGSQLALGLFLEKLGKAPYIVNADLMPATLEWLDSDRRIQLFRGTLEQRTRMVNADAVVVLDANGQARLGDVGAAVRHGSSTTYLIDHHPNPENWFAHRYVRTSASSTGELIYELIAAHDIEIIDRELAVALYVAIMTDTGSFRFNSVTPEVHAIVADLMRRGDFNPEPIHVAINTKTHSTLRLLGMALDSIQLAHGGKVGYMVISQRMLQLSGAGTDETEGFVDYVLSIEGVEAAVIFLDLHRNVKASFRSIGDTPVNGWARHFGGGGHRNASGAYMEGSIAYLVDEVIDAAPRFMKLKA